MATQSDKRKLRETVRIPLVGEANTRKFWNASVSAGPTSGYIGIGVIGLMVIGSGRLTPTVDQRFINVIPDRVVNPLTKQVKFYLYKRPGFETHSTPASGNIGTAIRVWRSQGTGNKIISAFGGTNSTIYDGTSSVGSITGVARDIVEADVNGTATLLIPVENSRLYYYQDGGSPTQVTDADYPGEAGVTTTGTVVSMDGYNFIMGTNGRIYNSDINSITAWTATSYVAAQDSPDQGVGIARYKDTIVAFGQKSIEFFRNVGNQTGSPLQRIKENALKIGAIDDYAIHEMEDTVVWIAAGDTGTRSVYMLEDFKPKRISSDTVDTSLMFNAGATFYISSMKIAGKTFVIVQYGVVNHVYCVEDDMWHEWNSGNAVLWNKCSANPGLDSTVYSISRESTSGKVYKINPTGIVYDDDGTAINTTVQTSKVDMDTENRKFLHRLTLVGDNAPTAFNMSVQWSDDDYDTFSAARTVGMASDRKYLSSCGSFRRRSFKLTETSSYPWRLEALELVYTEGQH